MSAAFCNGTASAFTELQRYAASIERTGHRAVQQLLALRKLARRNEPNSASPAKPPQPAATPPTPTNSVDNGALPWSDHDPAGRCGPASPDRREEAPCGNSGRSANSGTGDEFPHRKATETNVPVAAETSCLSPN
jgi:hypothetical protein